MKKILGLDLGTTSIGWAYVKEGETETESGIVNLGVRIVPLTTDEENDFAKGNTISINADRTLKRGARRGLQRFKLRRNALIHIFKQTGIIAKDFNYAEFGAGSTFSTLALRAKSAKEEISKQDLVKVLLSLNKKRGYKSSRKAKSEEGDGQAVDSMGIAKELYDNDQTPGQWVLGALKNGRKNIPDFYRSDLQDEFKKIVDFQSKFYPEIFALDFVEKWLGKAANVTKTFFNKLNIPLAENPGKRNEKIVQQYTWRTNALVEKLDASETAFVLSQINGQINASSGYLGAISDRSKELYFNKETIGEYLYNQILKNSHTRLKGQVFYRQDYLDEFEKIWETQSSFHSELTIKLKKEVRDVTIFYQRRLKSQKHLISQCEFEIQHKVAPKSSPLFQEFRIWQNLNNLVLVNKINTSEKLDFSKEHKEQLSRELAFKKEISAAQAIREIGYNDKLWDLNFPKIEGNRTNQSIFEAFVKIIEIEDGETILLDQLKADDILDRFSEAFLRYGINTDILQINTDLEGNDFELQTYVQFWHLLYSSEEDQKLKKNLIKKFGVKDVHCKVLLDIDLQPEHCSLSTKALKKILPYLKEGYKYDEACAFAGYNHSSSLNKEDNEKRILKPELDLLKKNSLRNPVVEKILNQMINLINAIIKDPELGAPDEIRIEMARELKATAEQRKNILNRITQSTKEHDTYRSILRSEFGIPRVTRNDIIRYKLWKETDGISIYTGKPIEASKLFSKEYDVEHIIPKSRLFDDSFANKTICERQLNIDKSNSTAFSYLQEKFSKEDFDQYQARVKSLFGKISKPKTQKLLMANDQIPEDFINRQLSETQYISKKAKEILFEITRKITVTTGSVTDKLRDDWELIDVMKELNWDKFHALGLTTIEEGKHGERLYKIKDWSKRNDHRHHAMDALTVALTKPAYIQYLNNLNARGKQDKKGSEIYGIEQKYLSKENGKLKFKSPFPNLRNEAKKHLANVLISYKAKNKVVTINKNITKSGTGTKEQITLTPRGQLHKETVYGKSHQYDVKWEKVNGSFDSTKIETIANKSEREALTRRLKENGGDAKKAFTGKNALSKMPVYISLEKNITVPEKVKLVTLEAGYTIRKDVTPANFKDSKSIEKVIDAGNRQLLQKRLDGYNGDAKSAFSNLDENPIWQNKEKGVSIKRVKISGVSNVESLHIKRDHFGKPILNQEGKEIPVDFVSTGNNHHVAIYKDDKGDLQEEVVSFYEAVIRKNQAVPIVKKQHELGWEFLFTMKQNEYFIFPAPDFNPSEIDLTDPENYYMISPNLYRVQKFGSLLSGFWFRHHLETSVEVINILKGQTFKVIQSANNLKGVKKVRINHLGKIIQVGEF